MTSTTPAGQDRTRFALHYLQILAGPLGLATRILPDGTVHTPLDAGDLHIINTAPHDPERLDLALTTTPTQLARLAGLDPHDPSLTDPTLTATALAATRDRLGPGTTLHRHPDHPELLTARCDTVLAPPDQLPDPTLLTHVLPRLIDRLHHTLEAYLIDTTLTGITHATAHTPTDHTADETADQ